MDDLLLLHGAIGAKDQLENIKEQLAQNYNVYSLNFSGHGGEDFKTAFNIDQFTADVLLYLEEQQLEKINVFGYSMGGYVALYLAKHHSNKIGNIITLGTKFKWTPEIAVKEVKMLNTDRIEDKIPAFASSLKGRHTEALWKEVLSKTAAMMLEMGTKPPLSIQDYKDINHLCKIMLADNDEMVTEDETLEVVRSLQNASFSSIINSKHPIEKVDLVQLIEEIQSFI